MAAMSKSLTSRAVRIIKEEGVRSFSKKVIAYAIRRLEFLCAPWALAKIRRLKPDRTLNNLLNFAFNDLAGFIKPSQVKSEISGLLEILAKIKPKVILEIGTANGGTLFLFSCVASKNATIISVDLPGGRFGGGYPIWRKLLYKSFALPNQQLILLRADSHKGETLAKVKAILGETKLDFLFIDGEHTYDGVKKDFEMYSPLVRQGGIIAFHDIVSGPVENVGRVPWFWEEIKRYHNTEELVENWNQGGYGIGLLWL